MTVDPTAETAAEPARAAAGPAAGDTLGKYRLDRILGAGGMGIVWAAFDPDLERAVAIKLLRSGDGEPTLRSRLLREARAMARLKHPNVLTVYEVGTVQNRDYIAMELVDGDNLDAWLATSPPRDQVVEALLAAGRGLAAAHEAGLVHRDFKPQNVLRSRDGHVYVTDFGLARGSVEEGVEVEQFAVTALPDELARASQFPRRPVDSVLDSPLTQTGVLIGTPAYMAPEQFAGRMPDARSDQFAFCVTAWEALSGTRPFRGSTLVELEAAAGRGVRSVAGDLPPRLRAVLTRGLDPSPAARWDDLPSLLHAFTEAAPRPPGPPARPSRRRRWLLAAGAAATSTGLAITLALYSATSGSDPSGAAECGPAEAAFANAWSAERRAIVMEAHPSAVMIGGAAILDGVRRQWMEAYRKICAAPRTPETRAQLTCLIETRDALARTTARLAAAGSRFQMQDVVRFAPSVALCKVGDVGDVDDLGTVGESIDVDVDDVDIDVHDLPAPPRPPPRPGVPPPPRAPAPP